MKKYIKILILLILFYPSVISAKECTKEETNKFNKLVNKIEINYDHNKDNMFTIKMSNISKEIIVVDKDGKQFTKNSLEQTLYEGGKTYTFKVLPVYYDCELSLSFNKTITIPKYNIYSEKSECKKEKYKDFDLCDKYYQGKINDKIFETELKKYKSNTLKFKYIFITLCIINIIILTIILIHLLKNNKKVK